MAALIVVQCQRCGQSFSVTSNRAETAKFCSRECYYPKHPDRPCEVCGNPLQKHKLADETIRYCSVKCKVQACKDMGGYQKPLNERFWEKVDKAPGYGPDGDCWVWTGTVDEDGYGRLIEKGKVVKTHIHSYRINNGEIPSGEWVLHRCDVRNCVRPEHLWLGDAAANTADMIAKGRDRCPFGQNHYKSKLTDEQAMAILRDVRPQNIIAAEYGVSKASVCMIKKRKTWKHLAA